MYNFVSFNTEQLRNFVFSESFENLNPIPITRRRAKSQILNPKCKPDDKILFVVFQNNNVCAYIGILPDYLRKYPEVRFGWISCWWAEKNVPANIVFKLLLNALEAWDFKIMATDLTPLTKNLLLKFNEFSLISEIQGLRIYFRFYLHKILLHKLKLASYFKIPLLILDKLCNTFIDVFTTYIIPPKLKNINYNELTSIEEHIDFIQKHSFDKLTDKTLDFYQWIISEPWIGNTNEDKEFQKKYYFSSYCKNFNQKFYSIHKNYKLIAIIWLTIRDKNIKTSGLWLNEPNVELICEFLLFYSQKIKAISLTTYNKLIIDKLSQMKKRNIICKRKIFNYLIATQKMKNFLTNENFSLDGEGDYYLT